MSVSYVYKLNQARQPLGGITLSTKIQSASCSTKQTIYSRLPCKPQNYVGRATFSLAYSSHFVGGFGLGIWKQTGRFIRQRFAHERQ